MLVQGSVELMKTRYAMLTPKEIKQMKNNYLADRKNNKYPLHKSLSNEELVLFNSEELSLLGEINYLKMIGFATFRLTADGRTMSMPQ